MNLPLRKESRLKMYSASINSTFSSDENGKIELELLYKDSDGKDIGAYSTGQDLSDVLEDIADQLEEALAETNQEDQLTVMTKKIDDLTAQVQSLTARNADLENKLKNYEKEDHSPVTNDDDYKINFSDKRYSELLDKINSLKNKNIWGDDFAPLFKHVIA